MQKIIFLDIDGPVIPGRLCTHNSMPELRLIFAKDSIQLLNELCDSTGARIVTNSMHNYLDIMNRSLKQDLITWGLEESNFHKDSRTCFPKVNYAANPSTVRGWGRWLGILDWQQRNGEADWICFDDRVFTTDPRLVEIEFEDGITNQSVQRAMSVFGSADCGLELRD